MICADDSAPDSSPQLLRTKDLRILAVVPGDGLGNSFIFARRQVESLTEIGLDVKVFYLRLRKSLGGLLTEWRRFTHAIKDHSPDVVHAHYGTITSFLCVCSTRRPVVVTFRGSDLNPDPGVGFLRARFGFLLSQLSAFRASMILCTSNRLRQRLWWGKKKATVLPSGVDLALFQPRKKEESRKLLNWRQDECVVLFNRGNAPLLKGLPLAREAVILAQKNRSPVRFFELNGDVPPERIPLYLNGADCLVVASESEGSPNILKEAMACNLPVASVDVGDAAERLAGVSPSRVVERNAISLGRAISEILESGKRSNGREKILDCAEDKIAQELKQLYQSVVNRRNRGS